MSVTICYLERNIQSSPLIWDQFWLTIIILYSKEKSALIFQYYFEVFQASILRPAYQPAVDWRAEEWLFLWNQIKHYPPFGVDRRRNQCTVLAEEYFELVVPRRNAWWPPSTPWQGRKILRMLTFFDQKMVLRTWNMERLKPKT